MKRMIMSMLFEFFLDALADAAERSSNSVDDQLVELLERNADEITQIMEERF